MISTTDFTATNATITEACITGNLEVDVIVDKSGNGITMDGIIVSNSNVTADTVCANLQSSFIEAKTNGNIVVRGNVLPEVGNTYNIGSSGQKFMNVYACQGIFNNVNIGDCLTYQENLTTTTDNASNLLSTIILSTDAVYLLEIKVIALRTDAVKGAAFYYTRAYRNNSGTAVQIGGTDNVQFRDDGSWTINVTPSGGNVTVSVSGRNGETIDWAACIGRYEYVL